MNANPDASTSAYPLRGGESLLLLDEALIQEEDGITREVQPCAKIPFVMEPDPDKLWEYCGPGMSKRIHLYGTALYDDLAGKYRMWYFGRMGPHWRVPDGNYQIPELYVPRTDERPFHCNGVTADRYGRPFVDNDRGDLTLYAESDDGINWTKPELGIFTFNGSAANNIIWDLHGASVFIDRDEENPDQRYKAIGFCRRYRSIFLLTSPDGIHWHDNVTVSLPGQGRTHNCLEPVVKRSNEGTFNVTWDPVDSVYRAYSLQRFDDSEKRRVICYSESPSLAGPWKDSYPILEPGNWDDEIARRRYGALRAEFHNMSAFRYGSLHIGLLGVLYVTAEQIPGEKNQIPCDGPIDGQFVYSRDGISWQHADRTRTVALPRGAGDAFDRGMIIGTAKEPIIEGDEIHWYYTGCEHTHGEVDMEKRVKRLGRATWQRDRFVALAAASEGIIVTKLLHLPAGAGALEVNADAAGGQLHVELCRPDGRVLDGFSRTDCLPLQTDDLHWQVRWKNEQPAIEGAVQIRFLLDRSKLYSFTFRAH